VVDYVNLLEASRLGILRHELVKKLAKNDGTDFTIGKELKKLVVKRSYFESHLRVLFPLGTYAKSRALRLEELHDKPCIPFCFSDHTIHIYDSVVTFALAFVTFTPSAFAFAMISTRLRADTACATLRMPISIPAFMSLNV
jgi:hypothetical protein